MDDNNKNCDALAAAVKATEAGENFPTYSFFDSGFGYIDDTFYQVKGKCAALDLCDYKDVPLRLEIRCKLGYKRYKATGSVAATMMRKRWCRCCCNDDEDKSAVPADFRPLRSCRKLSEL